jgi:hypothetical protein
VQDDALAELDDKVADAQANCAHAKLRAPGERASA